MRRYRVVKQRGRGDLFAYVFGDDVPDLVGEHHRQFLVRQLVMLDELRADKQLAATHVVCGDLRIGGDVDFPRPVFCFRFDG